MTATHAYFEDSAPEYRKASEAFPWKWLRAREKAAMIRLLPSIAGQEVLELGCGSGYYTGVLLEQGARQVVAVDYSPAMLAQLPAEGVTPVHADVTSYHPGIGRLHSFIIACGVLEFLPQPEALFAAMSRYTSSGAQLLVLYPRSNVWGMAYRLFHRSHGVKIMLFSAADIEDMAALHGWKREACARVFPFTALARFTRVA